MAKAVARPTSRSSSRYEGRPRPDAADGVPRREDPLLGTAACPPTILAVVIGGTQREVRPRDREVRLGALPRRPADGGLDARRRHPRRRAGGAGLRAHASPFGIGAQFGKYFSDDVASSASHATAPSSGGHRRFLLGGPAGARQDHAGGRVPRAARDAPGPLHAGAGMAHDIEGGVVVLIDLNQPMAASSPSSRSTWSRPALADRTAVVARDIAHAKIKERLDAGEETPDYLRNHPVYYAWPAKTPEGSAVRASLPDDGRSHGLTSSSSSGRGRIDGHARQGQPLEGRHRRVPRLRTRVRPRLRSAARPPDSRRTASVRRGRRDRGAGHGGRWKIDVEDFRLFIVVDDKGDDFSPDRRIRRRRCSRSSVRAVTSPSTIRRRRSSRTSALASRHTI